MSLFEDSLNLLNGNSFSNVEVNESYLYIDSPKIFCDYLVPLRFLSKFDGDKSYQQYLNALNLNKNIAYYIKDSLLDDYKLYLKKIGLSQDSVDCFVSKKILSKRKKIDLKSTKMFEVNENNINEYLEFSLKTKPNFANEEDYNIFFYNQIKYPKTNKKVFRSYILSLNSNIIATISVIYDLNQSLAYIHNLKITPALKATAYAKILLENIFKICELNNIHKVFSIIDYKSSNFKLLKKLKFKTIYKFYVYS